MLADATTGFNARLAAIAASYGITAFAVDWDLNSTSFIQSFVDPSAVDVAPLIPADVAALLYTSLSSESHEQEGRTKFARYSGQIILHLDFYLRFDDGMEPLERNTEDIADAIEDAVIQVLRRTDADWPAGVVFNGDVASPRESIVHLADGYGQRIPFTFLFEVHV